MKSGILCCLTALLLCGYGSAGPAGKEFALSFMENYRPENNGGPSRFMVDVSNPPTSKEPTKVKVTALGKVYEKYIQPGQGDTFQLPDEVEMIGCEKHKKTVLVEADQEILVSTLNYKPFTADTSVIYPVNEWGTEYYIYTPELGPPGASKEFAITNHKTPNSVEVNLKGVVQFQGSEYPKGSKLTIELGPFESVQIQSQVDLTGSMVKAKEPVAVFTGHSCTWYFSSCNHVYEQLLPVSNWGREFIVATLAYTIPTFRYDTVQIQASKKTVVKISGVNGSSLVQTNEIQAGESIFSNVTWPNSLHIIANEGIQVLYLFTGGVNQHNVTNDPFLINILPTNMFSTSYTLEGQTDFTNEVIFIAHTKDLSLLSFDKLQLSKNLNWRKVFDSEYSWADMQYKDGADFHHVSHPNSAFGLYSVGVSKRNGYGSSALGNPTVAPSCPENSHFSYSASSCPATCGNPSPPSDCDKVAACICNEGYLRRGETCVPASQCDCVYLSGGEKHILKPGESIWADNTCTRRCTCNPNNGQLQCETTSCPTGKACQTINQITDCYPVTYSTCTISGDPHYNTFDNSTYDFQGTCTYTTAQTCHIEGTQLTPFKVVVENDRWNKIQISPNVSVVKVVIIEVYDKVLILRRNELQQIMVNGALTNIPLSLLSGKIKVFQEGTHYTITTDFGLKITYDMVYHVAITIPSIYKDKMCGLCGNFNGIRTDDYQLPDGKQAKDIKTFGAAWKVPIDDVCDDGCSGDMCPKCNSENKIIYENDCSIITDPKGPFAACHSFINPNFYYNNCVYDVCMGKGDRNMLCQSINSYMIDCQNFGVVIKDWRTPTFCPVFCPANSHYETCKRICSTPCPGLTEIITCNTNTCAEGCACDSGFYFNGTSCVKADQCSCYEDGKTYKIGQTVVTDDCSQRLTCFATGHVKHEKMECKDYEVCEIQKGVRGCYPRQCTMNSGGNFTFFNGGSGPIKANGAFDIVTVCNGSMATEWFRVVMDVQACGEDGVTKAVALYAFFKDMVISVNSELEIWLNGMKTTTPSLQTNDIDVLISKEVVTIEKSGLRVSYNIKNEVSVTVSGQLADKVCGACRDLNRNTKARPFRLYMEKYRAADFPRC